MEASKGVLRIIKLEIASGQVKGNPATSYAFFGQALANYP
jgi:hypothetical protein